MSARRHGDLCRCLEISGRHLAGGSTRHFMETLPAAEHWRLFPDLRDSVAYLDIETSGLGVDSGAYITTIAVYDGSEIHTYVHGENLRDFCDDIGRYKLLVTFNGKSFDIPFIERYFLIHLPHAHIDLRYVLRSVGLRGGLKSIERQTGIDRGELDGLGGEFAPLLWDEFRCNRDHRALETLLAYNIEDVVNLEYLLVLAFNMKLADTPFVDTQSLAVPEKPPLPFFPHPELVERLRRRLYYTP